MQMFSRASLLALTVITAPLVANAQAKAAQGTVTVNDSWSWFADAITATRLSRFPLCAAEQWQEERYECIPIRSSDGHHAYEDGCENTCDRDLVCTDSYMVRDACSFYEAPTLIGTQCAPTTSRYCANTGAQIVNVRPPSIDACRRRHPSC